MNGRIVLLDYFKIALSILVIIIHTSFDGVAGYLLPNGICRIAVPCFFLINGYFVADKLQSGTQIWKYISKLLIIYIVWTLIYFPHFCYHRGYFLLLECLLGYAHLWYVPALIIVLAILYLFRKLIDRKILCITIATVLFIAGYCLQQYVNSLRLEPSLFVISISRNALFFALPFVLFGVLIRKWVSKTLPIKPNVLFSATLIFSLFLLVEIGINIYSTRFQQQDIYLSLLALCPLLFLCVLQKGKVEKGDDYIARLGNAIYFTHFMVMVFLHGLFPSHSEVILLPVQIFITLLLSIGVIKLNKHIKIFL